jgi:hypothetical protein
MKKIFAPVIALVVCLNLCFSIVVSSALSDETFFKASLSGEEFGVKGEKYVVTLNIGEFGAEEFLGATCNIDYDASVFEIDSTYMNIIDGVVSPENGTSETYPLVNGENGWVFWGKNNVDGLSGTFAINVLNDSSDISSLKGSSVECFVEFRVKSDVESCESVIKIDTDEELVGVFSETLIESKNGTGSELTIKIVDEIHSEPDYLIINDQSTYIRQNNNISSLDAITKVKDKTTVSDFLANFDNKAEFLTVVYEGETLENKEFIRTGAYIQLLNGEEVVDEAVVIIVGDVDPTGSLDTTDYMRIKNFFLDKYVVEGAFLAASDVDGSGTVDSTDYLRLKSHFLGLIDIYA